MKKSCLCLWAVNASKSECWIRAEKLSSTSIRSWSFEVFVPLYELAHDIRVVTSYEAKEIPTAFTGGPSHFLMMRCKQDLCWVSHFDVTGGSYLYLQTSACFSWWSYHHITQLRSAILGPAWLWPDRADVGSATFCYIMFYKPQVGESFAW